MLRARGQTQRALELYEEARRSRAVPHSRMLAIFIGPELLIDAGRRDEAREAIAEGRRLAQADGSLEPARAERVRRGEARAAAREGPGAGARRSSTGSRASPARGAWPGRPRSLDTFYGLALLLQGHDAPALARLRLAQWRACRRAAAMLRAADRRRVPGRGRVARRQRGRRGPRRRHRARGGAAAGVQPHPHAGARGLPRRALAPHRRRAERGLDLAPASAAR